MMSLESSATPMGHAGQRGLFTFRFDYHMGYFLIFGTVVFAIIGGIWWLITGHRPPTYLGFWWVGYCMFVVSVAVDNYIEHWREESTETAKLVKEIMQRVENIESLLEWHKRD